MSSLKKYKKIKYLGKGSYGAAILVELRTDPSQKFVIKEIVIGHLKPQEQQNAKNEAEVLHQMNHSNITMYIESFVENSKLYIVMEHADGGDLSGAILKRKNENYRHYDEEEVMRIFVQICLAMRHVHQANILHRDLKSQNIFLTQKGMVKLGDFGIAKVLDQSEDQAKTQIGTPYYLSPEICESQPYGRKSDIWSLGVVLYELLALEMPFQATSLPALVHKIVTAEPNYTKLEQHYSSSLISLCKSLLLKSPDSRPTINQIVKNDFLKEHISRLLSFTLRSGTGGVNVAMPSQERIQRMDVDEADESIEQARNKERDAMRLKDGEGKESSSGKDRDKIAAREEEREKLRRFRQEMIQKKKDAESESRQPVVDEYRGNGSNITRDRSMSPKGGRSNPVQQYIPSANNPYSKQNQPQPRARSPVNNSYSNNRARSPMSNQMRPKSPVNTNSNYRDRSPMNNNPPRQAPAVNPPRPAPVVKSLAEMQLQRNGAGVAYQDPRSGAGYSGGGGGGQAGMVVYGNNDPSYSENAARREYFANRAAAQAVKAKVEAYERGGEKGSLASGPSSRRPSDDGMDPETRIAMLKAQREKEKEQEIALKEMQMKQAIEANREERRRLDALKQERVASVAFDIDIRSNAGISNVVSSSKSERRSLERDRSSAAFIVGDEDETTPPRVTESSNVSGKGGSRKGWGPPIEGRDIMQARAVKQVEDQQDEFSPVPSQEEMIGNKEVMQRLENKRRSQLQQRDQAKEVLIKLREKRLKEVKTRARVAGGGGGDAKVVHQIVSPVKRIDAADAKAVHNGRNGGNNSPSRGRLMGVLGQMDISKETSSPHAQKPIRVERRAESKQRSEEEEREIRAVRQLDSHAMYDVPNADDLELTLDSWWLQEQHRSVTQRKKKPLGDMVPAEDGVRVALEDAFDAEVVGDADDIGLYATDSPTKSYYIDNGDDTYDANRPLRAKLEGEDVEVVGMQCMLAQALMGEDEGKNDDFDDY